ncbi:putative TetR family transcriptional regulator [Ligilactobacillus ruminis]|nr:putative TetR family transcriptional regulator [Ligilactobacillus ruminis]
MVRLGYSLTFWVLIIIFTSFQRLVVCNFAFIFSQNMQATRKYDNNAYNIINHFLVGTCFNVIKNYDFSIVFSA